MIRSREAYPLVLRIVPTYDEAKHQCWRLRKIRLRIPGQPIYWLVMNHNKESPLWTHLDSSDVTVLTRHICIHYWSIWNHPLPFHCKRSITELFHLCPWSLWRFWKIKIGLIVEIWGKLGFIDFAMMARVGIWTNSSLCWAGSRDGDGKWEKGKEGDEGKELHYRKNGWEE